MARALKVCFWTTAFQADTQSLAYALATRDDFDVVVAMEHPERYRREAIWTTRPFRGRIIARGWPWTYLLLKQFRPDIVVVDNRVPAMVLGPRLLVLWHGFGWRHDDISDMRAKLSRQVGDVTRPNANFIWQAFGPWDRNYTIEHRGLHSENVLALGSAYSDDLLPESHSRDAFNLDHVRDAYAIDVATRPTLLMGLTWHHRGAFGRWGDESVLLEKLFHHLEQRGANALLRMHDRKRYPREYLEQLHQIASRHRNVQLKYKDESQDSFVDFMVCSALATNYSSLANAFYYTQKPTIHIDPSGTSDDHVYRRVSQGKVIEEHAQSSDGIWKLPPHEHGGMRAQSFDEFIAHVERALEEPTCCREQANDFIKRYITDVDGHTCARIAELMHNWCKTGKRG